MSMEGRIDALKAKHQALEEAILKEIARPKPDVTEIHALKKEKLKVKDALRLCC